MEEKGARKGSGAEMESMESGEGLVDPWTPHHIFSPQLLSQHAWAAAKAAHLAPPHLDCDQSQLLTIQTCANPFLP